MADDDREIGRPGYDTNRIRHLNQQTRPGFTAPRGYLRIRAGAAAALALYACTWPLGSFDTARWTTLVAAAAAMTTARHSMDPEASDASLTIARTVRVVAECWLLCAVPAALYTMQANGIAALLTHMFSTP